MNIREIRNKQKSRINCTNRWSSIVRSFLLSLTLTVDYPLISVGVMTKDVSTIITTEVSDKQFGTTMTTPFQISTPTSDCKIFHLSIIVGYLFISVLLVMTEHVCSFITIRVTNQKLCTPMMAPSHSLPLSMWYLT